MTTKLSGRDFELFSKGAKIQIVAEASDGNTAYKLAIKSRPDMVILDIRMPEGDGLSCLCADKKRSPRYAGPHVQLV